MPELPESEPTPAAAQPAVCVVLVSWNATPVLARCLESLRGEGHEVVVVDNASTDGSADLVATRFPWAKLIRQTRNCGFAGGVNAALPGCHADLVLLLNCDTVARPGAIARLGEVVGANADCAAAGGHLLGDDGSSQHGFQARRFPTLATWLVDLWLVDRVWPGNPVTRRYHAADLTRGAATPVAVDQPAGACLMVRRQVLEDLGGLDERFWPAWFEDVDLCRRMHERGWRILFVPDALFTHTGGLAMRELGLAAFSRVWYRNLQRYIHKHDGARSLVVIKGMIVSGMALRIAATLVTGRWRDARAYLDVAVDTLVTWPSS